LREFILEQAKINANIAKKLAVNNKVLENINIKMDSFSSGIKDQLSYNKQIESQIAQLSATLPFATNHEQANAITTRSGKSTRDPPYPKGIGRTPVVPIVPEEKKDDEVEEVAPQESQDQEIKQDFPNTNFLPFPCKISEPKRMSNLISL
jgi:hypothetical protein